MEKNIDGMVSQMNRINTTMTAYRVTVAAALLTTAAVALGSLYLYSAKVAELQSRIYVLDNGESFSAHSQGVAVAREDEVRHQITEFHRLLFDIPPSREMVERNMDRVLRMGDRSVYNYYNDLQETGFYDRMSGTNSYQQIDILSVDIDMETYPYAVTVHAHQYITRQSNITQCSLTTRCRVVNTVRSPDNLHGLMIEGFAVTENAVIGTRTKR